MVPPAPPEPPPWPLGLPRERCVVPEGDGPRPPAAVCRGDPEGAFAIRRKLLSPGLRGFGAARRQDVCVLWTGGGGGGVEDVEAVCYPPCGWLPACLLHGWRTGWTIMPNAFRRPDRPGARRIYVVVA